MKNSAHIEASDAALTITEMMAAGYDSILSPDACAFLAELENRFGERRRALLDARTARQQACDAGTLPDFLDETRTIRESEWRITGTPAALADRRVEITGPVDRKMMINALNSGANVFMADFEDATAPTWRNLIDGQINARDFTRGALKYTDPNSAREYSVGPDPAILMIRPRGWHLSERHALLDGMPMSASLFDFGLHFFHCGKAMAAAANGPYYYLPKLESYQEATLWDDVFRFAQQYLGLPVGTIKTTILIETLPAAFQMDEILYALKDHIVGLNCGRWDYIFSYIKTIGKNPAYLLPDRAEVGMGDAFLRAYSLLLVKTCHRRGAHAMGGMAAQIPVKNDDAANDTAFAKVRADKEREAQNGHDGTWVAHPALVQVAKEVFDRLMPGPNQLDRQLDELVITRDDLLRPHKGTISEDGLRENIRVGIQYLEAWLGGRGAVPLYNLMEDAATAEISRTQIWQQLHLHASLDDGRKIDARLIHSLFTAETVALKANLGAGFDRGHFTQASELFLRLVLESDLAPFLTLPAYDLLDT